MIEENDPLKRDGDSILTVTGKNVASVEIMEVLGPNLGVDICALTGARERLAWHRTSAVIDTGSQGCCISPRMVPLMSSGVEGYRDVATLKNGVKRERTIKGVVRFENGVEFERDFSVEDYLEPYDVLIGRDILKELRMYFDLGNAHFRLYFPAELPRSTD
jgi:hypothetical protein